METVSIGSVRRRAEMSRQFRGVLQDSHVFPGDDLRTNSSRSYTRQDLPPTASSSAHSVSESMLKWLRTALLHSNPRQETAARLIPRLIASQAHGMCKDATASNVH